LNDLAITDLQAQDVVEIRRLIDADDVDYRRYFVAFDVDAAVLGETIARAQRDRYWGIRTNGRLISVFMLRGLDEGYAAPAFGVYVAQSHASKGIARLALQFAIAWCRLNGCDEVMLSVHPDHAAAVHIYEQSGFQFTGNSSSRGHNIYRKKLS
jgi:GNAT superfamily N-acetyltransferase